MATVQSLESWRKRLYLPAYQVVSAARYAGVSTQTLRNWQRASKTAGAALAKREPGESLSYLQLQELAMVAAMRNIGLDLQTIRLARDYLGSHFQLEFPFSDKRIKTDGQDVIMRHVDDNGAMQLLVANKGGQCVWGEIIGDKFAEFEYEKGLAVRWNIGGTAKHRVIIDPRVSFGAPSIHGVPTWSLAGRFRAGESVEEIAVDFALKASDVKTALGFEQIAA